jgi:hypothetical protein
MHCLTARALGCLEEMQMAERWFLEDAPLLRETRRHHFTDRLPQAHALLYDKEFLKLLAQMRCTWERLPDDDGPYHCECFPWDHFAPEQELLNPGSCAGFDRSVPLDADVEEILVELLTGPWA